MENIFYDLGSAFWHAVRPVLSALSPLLTGLLLAYILHPAADWLTPKTGSRGTAILITYTALAVSLTVLTAGFAVLILGALPTGDLEDTISTVAAYFAGAYNAAADFLSRWLPAKFATPAQAAESLQTWLGQQFSGSLPGLLSSFSEALVTLFLGTVASIYLLKDREYFLLLWDRFLTLILPQKTHGIVCEILHEINIVISAFLKGALIDSIIIAFLSSAALSVLQIDFAVVIGIIGGVLNVIPYFGPFFGMIPAFFTALFTGGLAKSIAAVLALFLIQQLDSNYIYPRIVGSSTGLHPLFVLLAVSIFGSFFGLAGMLLAVPAAGVIQVVIRYWTCR